MPSQNFKTPALQLLPKDQWHTSQQPDLALDSKTVRNWQVFNDTSSLVTLIARRFAAVSPNMLKTCECQSHGVVFVQWFLGWSISSEVAEAARGPGHLRLLLCFHANSRYLAGNLTCRIQLGHGNTFHEKKGRVKIKMEEHTCNMYMYHAVFMPSFIPEDWYFLWANFVQMVVSPNVCAHRTGRSRSWIVAYPQQLELAKRLSQRPLRCENEMRW